MKKKKAKKRKALKSGVSITKDILSFYSKLADFKKEIGQVKENHAEMDARFTDLEIHISLLTRLLTTLCVERFGIRAAALKSLVRRIEKEAVRDSQIMELESIYKLSQEKTKKNPSAHPRVKDDPWDRIS